jgi:hypothetical protein
MNQFPSSPRVFLYDRFNFFQKFAELFASQGAPPVSTTPTANFSTSFASVVDTGGKFATGVNDPGSKVDDVTETTVLNRLISFETSGTFCKLPDIHIYFKILFVRLFAILNSALNP